MEIPKGKKALKNKWVFKFKKDGNKLVKYKAHLVMKGFRQKRRIDFDKILSPVVKMSFIRVILRLAASLHLELEQLDMKTVFLCRDSEEESMWINQKDLRKLGRNTSFCRLKKSLYGLK